MTNPVLIDLLLRGAFIGLAAYIILQCLAERRKLPFCWPAVLFLTVKIAYILVSAPPLDDLVGPIMPILIVMARIGPALLWWFAMSLFDERPQAGIILGLLIFFSLAPYLVPDAQENVAHNLILFPLMAHILWVALRGYRGDLITPRRRFRLAFAAILPVVAIVIGAVEIIYPDAEHAIAMRLLQSSVFVTLTLLFVVWMTKLDRDLLLSSRPKGQLYDDEAQEKEMRRLQELLNADIHRTEGLSIGSLAEAMEIPEHRLRRLINHHMGYRNISELINDRRIDDAKEKLSDPLHASRQITQIAFEVGYGSLAPFNRAFRERTGLTPKQFRQKMLPGSEDPADVVPAE